jgi:hypothetical protein
MIVPTYTSQLNLALSLSLSSRAGQINGRSKDLEGNEKNAKGQAKDHYGLRTCVARCKYVFLVGKCVLLMTT